MNIQIVKPQPGPQAAFIQCTADVVCYGGARGGGKSWAIALDFWLHAERHGEDARGLILRKTREDLKDFIDTAGRHVCRECAILGEGELLQVHDRREALLRLPRTRSRCGQLPGLEPHAALFRRVDAVDDARPGAAAPGDPKVGEGRKRNLLAIRVGRRITR